MKHVPAKQPKHRSPSDSLYQKLSDPREWDDPQLASDLKEAVLDSEGPGAKLKGRAFAPHCDQRILHPPGECVYCDHYPEWQTARETWGINYTGYHDPDKQPCPAEAARKYETLNRWGGNQERKA